MEPKIIQGNIFEDHRGSVAFVNDFKFHDIERFYIISNSDEQPVRAWQGHKLDCKNFHCIQGSFRIHYIKVDNWETPSPILKAEKVVLTADNTAVLRIPAGYANAIEALEPNSRLMSFSTLPLDRVKEDDVRFPPNTWCLDSE